MFHRSNPRWMRFVLVLLMLASVGVASPALAGNTHSEGGAVVEAPGVPETDGTAPVQIYWTGDSAARATTTVGSTLGGYWLQDVGFALTRPWQVGDEHIALLELQTNAASAAHAGFYGLSTKNLTSLDPDEFPGMTVRPLPVPMATAGGGFVDLHWHAASDVAPAAIAGYSVFRSTDGIAFTKLNAAVLSDTTYHDAGVVFGTNYQYALGLVYRGTPQIAGTALSANSAVVTPLDTTPPNVPVLAALPPFTSGTQNHLAWTSQTASGATAYYAECALDSAFTSLQGNSGWIADSTFTFTGLADGRTYYYHVRARDAANNASSYSGRRTSRQDATAPQSNLLALTGYKSSSTVNLEWTAADSVSGVAGVQLYYSKNGAAYALYPGGPFTTSPIAFDASQTGGDAAYAFYTLATDAVANAEGAPESPDATFIIDTQAPASPALASLQTFTAGTSRSVSWASTAASGAVAYRAQASLSQAFDAIAFDSGWKPDTTYAFTGLADGQQYYYRVQARDTATNESSFSSLVSSTQDASAPATAVAALPALTNSLSLSIAWSGTDTASGLTGVQLYYSRDGGAYTLFPGGPFTTSPIAVDAGTLGGDGSYAFYTRGRDAVGNEEADPAGPDASLIADTQAPQLPALTALPAYTPGTNLQLQWSDASASGASAYLAQAASDAGFTSIVAESGWIASTSHTFSTLTDGQHYWFRLKARDAAGNETAFSSLLESTLDATAPSSQLAAQPAWSSQSALSLAWTGSDNTSGMSGVDLYYTKDGGTPTLYQGSPFATSPIAFNAANTGGDGLYTFFTRAHDVAGNLEAAPANADAESHIDTQAPAAPQVTSLPGFSMGSSRELAWTANGTDEYMAQISTSADFAAILAESGWMSGAAYTFNGLADGQAYFYRVRARDAAQNESSPSSVTQSTQDATAPATSAAALAALGNTAGIAIAWSGSDATSGIASADLYYAKDGGAFTLYPGGPFASSPIAFDAATTGGDGAYAFYTVGHDHAGNAEAAPAAADAETHIDTSAPGMPAIATLQSFSPGNALTLQWSNQSASGAIEYKAEMSADAAFTSIAATSGWTAQLSNAFTGLADGQSYWFRVRARDAAHNETPWSSAASTTLDATAPQSAVQTLAALSSTAQLQIAWSGSDATSGIANVDLYYSKDDASYVLYAGAPFASSPIAFDATTTGGDGHYRFYTRAHDGVGNIEPAPAAADAATQIDTGAPAAPSIAALPAFTAGTARAISWSNQSASGAIEYLAQSAGDASFSNILSQSGWITSTSYDFTGLEDGHAYFYRVKTRDAAHNESPFSALGQSTQDATAPASQLLALPAFSTQSTLSLAWSGSDATSGLTGVDVYWSKANGAYALLAGGPHTASPIAFDAASLGGDGAYRFYVRAHDAAGNVEDAPATDDAHTTIDTSVPQVPTLASLPSFLPGSSATLQWSDMSASGTVAYRLQASTQASFASLLQDSGWIAATNFTCNGLADGTTYYYRVQGRNAASIETGFSAALAATQDATAPTSQLAAIPSLVNTATLQLDWSGSDITSAVHGIDLYYSKNGAAFALYPGSPFTESPIAFESATTGGDGQYAFFTRAHDGAGNIEAAPGAADASTRIDTTAPNTPALASLAAFLPGSSLSISWSSQSASGAIEYLVELSASNGFASIAAQSGWMPSTSFVFNGLDDGSTYYIRVRSRDAAHNESAVSTAQSTTLDDTAPASQVNAMSATYSSATMPVAWSGNDATSGIAGVDLYYAREGGAYTLYPGGPYAASPIVFNTASTGGDGHYAFYTRARDAVGNREAAPGGPDAQTIVSTSAVPAPTLAALPAFNAGTSLTLGWASSSGASEYMAQASTSADFAAIQATSGWIHTTSFAFSGLTDGQRYYFRLKCRNDLGIESGFSAAQSTTPDATAPASQASALPATTTAVGLDIAWTASDATSGVASAELYYSKDSGPYTRLASGPFTASPIAFNTAATGGDGHYAFYTRALDNAGNLEAAAASPDAQTNVSTTAISIPTLASLPQFSAGTSRKLDWSAVSGASSYLAQVAEDAGFTSIVAASGWINTTTFTFNGLADGQTFHYRLKARNAFGIEGGFSAASSSTQDATAPLSQAAALAATRTTQKLDLVWTASDATSGVTGVDLYVSRDGGAFTAYPGGPFDTSPIAFDAALLGGDGNYAFYTRARDRAGNIETAPASPDAQTIIDSQPPAVPTITMEPISTPGTSNTVLWSAAAGASEYFAQCAGDDQFQNVIATSGWIAATSYTFETLTPGSTYYYRVRARDTFGNASAYSATVFSIQSAGYVLPAGWNLISFNVAPADRRIDHVLASIQGSYNIVRSYAGGSFYTYLPGLPVEMNDLREMDGLHGYWIYMTRPDTLEVGGAPIASTTPIDLQAGWQLVSYLPTAPMRTDLALGSIAGSYALARGYQPAQGYRSYYPTLPSLSDLTQMQAGRGYWMYMTAPDQLIYGGFAKGAGPEAPHTTLEGLRDLAQKSSGNAVPTVMDVYSLDFTLDGQPAPAGTIVEAYGADGKLCGRATVQRDGVLGLMHLAGDISVTESDEGALPGEAITFKVSGAAMTLLGDAAFAWQADATKQLELHFVGTESLLPKRFDLAQNSPNPFNPTTAIAYEIPARVDGTPIASTHVRLCIYDIRGRALRTLVSAAQAPGRYTAVWNGRDDSGHSVGSGVYFYRLETPQFTQARKMVLMK